MRRLALENFENAIDRLNEGLERYRCDSADTQIRDGLIQRFEFTYESSHRMLKRYLEMTAPSPEQYDTMPFQDLIRSGNEQGLLLGSWPDWKTYRDMRSESNHTYDEEIALEVVARIPMFIREATFLRDQLKQHMQ